MNKVFSFVKGMAVSGADRAFNKAAVTGVKGVEKEEKGIPPVDMPHPLEQNSER